MNCRLCDRRCDDDHYRQFKFVYCPRCWEFKVVREIREESQGSRAVRLDACEKEKRKETKRGYQRKRPA